MRRDPDDYSAEFPLPALGGLGRQNGCAVRVSDVIDTFQSATFATSRTFMLSDSTYAILRLAAAHDGVAEIALLTRLICQHGERVGLPGLLDAGGDLHAVPAFARAGVRRESG